MHKIAGFLKNRRIFCFLIILIIIFLGYFLIFKESNETTPEEGPLLGFSRYIIKDDYNVFRLLFPVYEHNPNTNSSLYSHFKVMRSGQVNGQFNVLINESETSSYSIESHQTLKIFDYNSFDKPKFAMYAIYISYPKETLQEASKEDLTVYAENQATSSGVELSNYKIINYRDSIAIEYEYPLQQDKNMMISKHLAFMTNGFIVNLSIVRTQYLTEKDVHFEQFINSFESTDIATGSLLLGNN